ncbi:AMP-binding protein [Bradyrhizobium erythrophlei]|uniref:AMP-binding protein n=1 Tax=Bradyrhizobium erythrophlei TaxID=1437360 RepID=UPI0035EB6CDE
MQRANRAEASADDASILPYLLARAERERGHETFAVFDDGLIWTYRDTADQARRVGSGLRRAGVERHESVLVWEPNGTRSLAAWFGINMLGAVFVGINTAYRGSLLRHVVENSDASVILCHPELAPLLIDCAPFTRLTTVFTDLDDLRDPERFAAAGLRLRSRSELQDDAAADLPVEGIKPWDVQSICYTSGTTGPSKGVLSSYLHLFTMGMECTESTTGNDRWVINLPLFHVGGTLFVTGAIGRGGSIAVLREFRTGTFFESCRALEASAACLLGSMATFLLRQPETAADRDHGLRRVMVVPLSEDARLLRDRFGFSVYTVFNMSEVSCPIRSDDNPTARGSCGRVRPGLEVRIVDENDCEVSTGEVGELILRSDRPWTLSHGYHKMPEATAKAWRNGWFHTGDAFRCDAEGNYFFVDRVKDAIRRRGENVSSFEVEAELLAHPAVLEAAVIGVPSELGEEEVLAVLTPKPGATIANDDLLSFLQDRLPHFMVPRYIRHTAGLPKTPTGKVEKHRLREEGVTPDAWDREAAGFRVRRGKLS